MLSPLRVPRWDELVLSHPRATIFHTSHWARVLHDTYRYEPVYLTRIEAGRLEGLIPFMSVRSALTGPRGVSLPFTDYCSLLLPTGVRFEDAFREVVRYAIRANWRYAELRCDETPPDGGGSTVCFRHSLDLSRGEQGLRRNLRESTWRNIKKAARAGVDVTMTASREALREFCRLNDLTRRRHGLPPQPLRFFEALHRCLLSRGLGCIALATFRKVAVAAAVFLHFGSRAVFKYGASDPRYHPLRANNLVLWEAIRWLERAGFQDLCLGRTEPENEGLLQFKRGWGAVEQTYHQFRYDVGRKRCVKGGSLTKGIHNRLFRAMPLPVLRLAGALLYRHAA